MKPEYLDWIDAYCAKHKGFVRGKCKAASLEMIEAFPELRLACGFVYCQWGEDQHFWCVDPAATLAGFLGIPLAEAEDHLKYFPLSE